MGTITNPIGNLRGKVGDFIFRNVNGKTIICMRARSYKKSNSQKSVNNRSKFKFSVMLSSSINKNPVLKEIWQNTNAAKQRATYNVIFQHVNKHIYNNDIDSFFNLFPGIGGVNAVPNNLEFNVASINVVVKPVKDEHEICVPVEDAKFIQMVGIIKCDNPIDPSLKDRVILSFNSNTYNFVLGKESNITLNIEGERREILYEYSSKRVLFGFVVLDENKNILCYSSTFDETIGTIPYKKSF
ncbi:MAG: hypothetical protein NTY74_13395 [Ignavibacteriae bacterium]|nr:hypothetical protein [Ignavibacteriota bacterium]